MNTAYRKKSASQRGATLPCVVVSLTVSTLLPLVVVESAEIQSKMLAIRRIECLGGTISYDYEWSKTHAYLPDANPPGSPALKTLFGDKYAANPVEIQLFSGNPAARYERRPNPEGFTDADAKTISVLIEVTWLVLDDTALTDDGLQFLSRITKLDRLDIEGTRVTSRGVDEFKRRSPHVEVHY